MGRGKSVERRLFDDDITSAVPALQRRRGPTPCRRCRRRSGPTSTPPPRRAPARPIGGPGAIPGLGRADSESAEVVAAYLAAHGESHAPATLGRWAVSLGRAHTSQGLADPGRSDLVRATLRGIRRRRGTAPRQVAPLEREALLAVLAPLGEAPRDARDRALLLIGFAAALRRSELVR